LCAIASDKRLESVIFLGSVDQRAGIIRIWDVADFASARIFDLQAVFQRWIVVEMV
jgi:hypothetical protein